MEARFFLEGMPAPPRCPVPPPASAARRNAPRTCRHRSWRSCTAPQCWISIPPGFYRPFRSRHAAGVPQVARLSRPGPSILGAPLLMCARLGLAGMSGTRQATHGRPTPNYSSPPHAHHPPPYLRLAQCICVRWRRCRTVPLGPEPQSAPCPGVRCLSVVAAVAPRASRPRLRFMNIFWLILIIS